MANGTKTGFDGQNGGDRCDHSDAADRGLWIMCDIVTWGWDNPKKD